MRRIYFTAIALLTFGGIAAAQQVMYVWTPLGYQQITPVTTPSTLTVPNAARLVVMCAETNNIRYRDDGVAPTATVGQPIFSSTCIQYSGSIPALLFQQVT